MSANFFNQVPYLRTSRKFPEDIKQLTVEVDKAYIDTANCVNNRTISIFPTNVQAINGESWMIGGRKHQGIRQVYVVPAITVFPFTIPHFIKFSRIFEFVRCFGSFTDGTNYYGMIYASNVAIAGQISFYLTPEVGTTPGNIVVLQGAAAPALTTGIICLEWISEV